MNSQSGCDILYIFHIHFLTLTRKKVTSQPHPFRCSLFQINQAVAERLPSRRGKGLKKIMSFSWIHLLGKMNNLGSISWIFKNHQVMGIQTNGAMFFLLIKQILHYVNNAQILMVTSFCEQTRDASIHTIHLIINHHQQGFFTVERKVG